MLVEVIVEDFGFPRFRLEPCPDPGMPAKGRIAGQVARGFRNGGRARRIGLKQFLREGP